MKSTKNNMRIIVKTMLEQGEVTASDIAHISNSNQYFIKLEALGVSDNRWHTRDNGTRCKMRFIKDRRKAIEFLNAYKTAEAIGEYVKELEA